MRSDLEPFSMVPRDLIGAVSPRALEVWAIMAAWYTRDDRVFQPPVARIARALGCGRRAIERALAELEQTGRLARRSGRARGRTNEYILRFCARRLLSSDPAPNPTQGYDEFDAATNKVVNIPSKHNPPTPHSVGGTAARESPLWIEFAGVYPRRDGLAGARAAFDGLSTEDQTAAVAGARILRTIYDAAPEDRRRYTVRAARWLAERRWTDPMEALERHYHVPGLTRRTESRSAAQQPDPVRLALRARKIVSMPAPTRNRGT